MTDVNFRESTLTVETLIKANNESTHDRRNKPVVEISSKNNFCSIFVSKYRMNKEVAFGIKLFQMLEDFQLHYRHIPSGVDALNLVLHEDQLHQEIENELLQRINKELSADKVTIKHNLALIMLIGEKMNHNVHSIARAAKALEEERINIEMIHMNQRSSHISLVFGVQAHDEKRAVEALHNKFFARVY